MKRIQNKLPRIGTYNASKNFLSSFDDKRYISGNGINSIAYFLKDIRSQQKNLKSKRFFDFMYPKHKEIRV